jgi:FkbM family methyltransferase
VEHGAGHGVRRGTARAVMLRTAVKAARNTGANALAEVLFRAPALERPYRSVAGACRRLPGVHTFFRETTDRLIRRLVIAGQEVRPVRIGALTVLLDVSHFTVAGRHFAGVPYEPGVTDVLLDTLKPGSVFVDVGANTGYFSVIAAMLVGPAGRVVSFEPSAHARERLQRQLQRNGVTPQTVVSSVALGDRDQENVDFYLSCSAANDGLSSLVPAAALVECGMLRTHVKTPVAVRTFDAVAAELAIPRVDLIKIDVEGAEQAVLAGMTRTLMDAPPRRIVCETTWESDAHRLLITRGYRARIVDEVRGGTPNLLFELDR